MCNQRLITKSITLAAGVGRIGCPTGIVAFEPAVGSVVDRQTKDRHVVGVHDTVHKTDTHPMQNHVTSFSANLFEPVGVNFGRRLAKVRKVIDDRKINQPLKIRHITSSCKNLKVTKPCERRSDPANDRPRFEGLVPVVKHIAHDLFTGRDQRQSPSRWHAEVKHRFAA